MNLSRRTMLTSMVAAAAAPRWSLAADARRVLVVYYSYTGHTGAVAEKLRAFLAADLYEIQMRAPYPLDMQRAAELSKYELETGELPPLLDNLPRPSKYDLILVGGPVWWNTITPPVMSFLEHTDFEGRKVAPFATYVLEPAHYEKNFAAQARSASLLSSLMVSEFELIQGQADKAITSWALKNLQKDGPQAL
ncbi:flavodoxin [Rhizobium sp. NPDC090279]|uniref:flavodoxin n=1 Tax=Rhizobium sp. NPDC090279 TaxID=3364499 RepID=UPI003839EC9E